MISYEEALAILRSQEQLAPVTVLARDACGYVAAQEVTSSVLVPPFANSAMDGFAVRSVDLAQAARNNPLTLPVMGSTMAGDMPAASHTGVWEIMTGAHVPQGYDAVVMVEETVIVSRDEQGSPQQVCFTNPVNAGRNIRTAGEDFMPGDRIVKAGRMLTPFHGMALATIGRGQLSVYPQPKVTVLSTGKEVVEDTDAPLLPGQIRNSNGPYLMAALCALPVQAQYGGVIHDEPELFESRMREIITDSTIIISTGAVSAGRHDFIPDSLRKLGAKILFHKVAIRPGKPLLYARFPNGTHYFGLPGNPVSAVVGLRFFVIPLLRHLQGMQAETPVNAPLTAPHSTKAGLRFFCKAQWGLGMDGHVQATILKGQESFRIQPLLAANGWAVFPEQTSNVDAGETVAIYPLLPEHYELRAAS